MKVLFFYLLIMNASAFLLMRDDKLRAIKRQWRIPESTLLGVAVLGGSLGGYLGMRIFRHKTLHPKFRYGLPALTLLHLMLLARLLDH